MCFFVPPSIIFHHHQLFKKENQGTCLACMMSSCALCGSSIHTANRELQCAPPEDANGPTKGAAASGEGERKAGGTPTLIRVHLQITCSSPDITLSFMPFHACEFRIGISSPHFPYLWGHLSHELGPISLSLKSKIWNLGRKWCVRITYKSSSSLFTNSVRGINKGACVHVCVSVYNLYRKRHKLGLYSEFLLMEYTIKNVKTQAISYHWRVF